MKSTMHIGILVSRGCSIHLSPSLLFYIIFHFRIGNSTAREPISNFPHYNFSQKSKNNKEVANIHLSTVKVCKPTQKHMTCISSNVITNENFRQTLKLLSRSPVRSLLFRLYMKQDARLTPEYIFPELL